MSKAVFKWVEFTVNWGSRKKGERVEFRDWIADQVVARGVAKFVVEPIA